MMLYLHPKGGDMADFEVRILKGFGPIPTGLGAYYLTDYLDVYRDDPDREDRILQSE